MASRSSNRAAVPEAKGALDKFKYEVASELGISASSLRMYETNRRVPKDSVKIKMANYFGVTFLRRMRLSKRR